MKKGNILAVISIMLLTLVTSLCISLEELPVIKVNAEVTVTDGKPAVEIVSVEQDTVSPVERPKGTSVGFPSVDAKAIINFGRGGVSYWAAEEYRGNGTYEFVLGFEKDRVPKPGEYLFGWDNVPGKESERLLWFLKDDLNIGWAETAEIRKSDDGKTIHIFKDENSAEIIIGEKMENAILNISGGRIHVLKVKNENGKLNLYGLGDGVKIIVRVIDENGDAVATDTRIKTWE